MLNQNWSMQMVTLNLKKKQFLFSNSRQWHQLNKNWSRVEGQRIFRGLHKHTIKSSVDFKIVKFLNFQPNRLKVTIFLSCAKIRTLDSIATAAAVRYWVCQDKTRENVSKFEIACFPPELNDDVNKQTEFESVERYSRCFGGVLLLHI